MDYIGIDLRKNSSQVCILTEDGELIERRIKTEADAVVQRLCSVPGVGPVVAATFASTLDEASRFLGAEHVRSYLGLVPREYSSGERQHRGRISKAGSVRARALLAEAAWSLLRWKTAWPVERRQRSSAARPRTQKCAARHSERPTESANREAKGTRCVVSVCPGIAVDTNRRFTESRM